MLGWKEIQGQLQQSPEILQGQRFSCPLLAAPAFSISTITWVMKGRVSALDSQKRVHMLESLGTVCLPLQSLHEPL